jgi:hypothetical protein
LRLVLQARQAAGLSAPRLRLLGHSFGCKVICAALQQMAKESADLLAGVDIDVVLLEAAFDNDALEAGKSYGEVPNIPNIRLLVSRSEKDTALKVAYVAAGALKLFTLPNQALGYAGPTDALKAQLGGAQPVSVDVGFTTAPGLDTARLVVADLTPLHTNDHYALDPATMALSGHHSDIFQPEIYRLIAQFIA